jgi:ankyrin repeat protein
VRPGSCHNATICHVLASGPPECSIIVPEMTRMRLHRVLSYQQVHRLSGGHANGDDTQRAEPLAEMGTKCNRLIRWVALSLVCTNVHASVADHRLAEAIRDGSLEGVTSAIRQGANVNADTSATESVAPPLIFAILRNRPEIVRALIEAQADLNDPHRFDYPLVTAVNADTRVLELILEAGPRDLNAHTGRGETALEHAAGCKAYIYANLLKNGVFWGQPPDCVRDARLLVKAGADPTFASRDGQSPLHIAVSSNNLDIARVLIDGGANIEATNVYGRTPLMVALEQYDSEMYAKRKQLTFQNGSTLPIIESLLHSKANPNTIDKGSFDEGRDSQIPYPAGYTPLTLAARHGWTDVAKLLLEHGASTKLTRRDGATALDLAKKNGHRRIVTLIEQAPRRRQ